MGYSRSILFILIAAASAVLQGQNFRYTIYDDDLTPFNKVNQTLQDHKGFLWVASDNGLYRFDGQNFEDFNLSLKSRHIQALVSKGVDTMFFANDSGIFKLFYEDEEVIIKPFIDLGEGTEIGYADQLFVDSQNNLWFSSSNGTILKAGGAGSNIVKFSLTPAPSIKNIFFGEDQNQTIWAFAPEYGLYHLDSTTGNFVHHPGFDTSRHFYVDKNAIYFVGSKVDKFSIESEHVLKKQWESPTHNPVFKHISKDLTGTFFIASNTSLFAISDAGQIVQKVFGSNDPHRIEELPFQEINHLNFTPDQLRKGGKIWVSTLSGIWLLRTSYFKGVKGMPHDNVFSMASRGNHEMLVSQRNLFQIEKNGGNREFKVITEAGRVTGIAHYGNNSYFGTADAQIVVFKERKKQQAYNLNDRGAGIFFMSADSFGDIWFCQAPSDRPLRGVGKLQSNGRLKFYDAKQGLNSRILVVKQGGRSEIYAAGIGVADYLFKYNREADFFESKSLPLPKSVSANFEVHDLSIDSLGVVWMGTTDGLLKYDTETIKRVDLGEFTKNEIRAVHAHENGGVWVATDTDGVIYRYPSGAFVQFGEDSGTPSKIASYRCLSSDKNGTLWLGTAEGAVHSALPDPVPLAMPEPQISGIRINNRHTQSSKLSLSVNDEITFGLTTISYPAKELRFQYKLVDRELSEEAVDFIEWSAPINDSLIHLQNFSPGHYLFLARAQKPGGYNWSEPVVTSFHVRKAWYKTWWGLGILLGLGLVVIWSIAQQWSRLNTKRLSTALSQKQHDLDDKQAELTAKSQALASKEGELKTTGANLFMLNRLLAQLPINEPWQKVLPILKKLVELPTGLDSFEIGLLHTNEVRYKGYHRENGHYYESNEEFNEKENLQSYALCANAPLLINDFEADVVQYLGKKPPHIYTSLLILPFKYSKDREAVFCAYAIEKNRFSQRDLTLIQVLVKFLSLTVIDSTQ